MTAVLSRGARGVFACALLALLAACALGREPAHDPAIDATLADMAVESQHLFAALRRDPPEPHATRAGLYRSLRARAQSVSLMAETRAARPMTSAGGALVMAVLGVGPGDAEAPAYAKATVGFMADYLRNLDWLETADRSGANGPSPTERRLRITVLGDILRDTLTYERRILKRGQ